jgi:recombination DNA repair RAD52 pathway protein
VVRLSLKQVLQLLRPIHPNRVLKDGKQHSHVSQQDVTAHLIRIFGFCNFDTDVKYAEPVFEEPRVNKQGEPSGRWDVCYRAMIRLTVKDPDGIELAHYEDGSTATAQNQTRGDAHDLAFKSSISLAKKRAAINLGDQFGLSLYSKGQTSALVLGTLVLPEEAEENGAQDMQDGVPRQEVLGNDEIDRPLNGDEDSD